MSIASIARPDSKLSGPARRDSHRFWIMIGAVAGIAVTLALCIYGFEYYILSSSARLVSTKHGALKPSGRIGHGLGIVGGGMLALMFLYPLRKRWKWLSRKGKTKHWLDYHILMGLVAPVLGKRTRQTVLTVMAIVGVHEGSKWTLTGLARVAVA